MRWLRGGPSAALTHGGHGMLRRAKGLSWWHSSVTNLGRLEFGMRQKQTGL